MLNGYIIERRLYAHKSRKKLSENLSARTSELAAPLSLLVNMFKFDKCRMRSAAAAAAAASTEVERARCTKQRAKKITLKQSIMMLF